MKLFTKTTLKSLNIWGEISEFKITYEVDNVNKAYNELKKTKFDLVLADTTLEDNLLQL